MKPPYRLAEAELSHDTVEVLEQMLAEARSGRVIGIAFVAMYKRRAYITDTAGEAYRNPTFTRGMLCALDDHLSDLAHQKN